MKNRIYSREVKVGNLTLGGKHPVLIQSMTNTSINDIRSTVEQIKRLIMQGCDIVRIAVSSVSDVESLKKVKQHLSQEKVIIPIVADVHYSAKVAESAAQVVEKVRINPGNYILDKTKEHYSQKDFTKVRKQITENIQPLLALCKKHHTALRIGVNWGSLSKNILYKYGNTALGMVSSALEFIDILLESGFDQFTLSLKASDVRIMQEANIMMVKEMVKRDAYFPLHLGVTEAGAGNDARIKSAAGIGALLKLGIGDTIRVSLTEEPEAEMPVAKLLLHDAVNKGVLIDEFEKLHFHPAEQNDKVVELIKQTKPLVITEIPNDKADLILKKNKLFTINDKFVVNRNEVETSVIESNEVDFNKFLIESSVTFAYDFLKNSVQAVLLKNPNFDITSLTNLSLDILQGMGLRYTKTEYVACPSCGRTLFDIMEHLKKVQKFTSKYKGVKIAVMGCVINGPGEMADADYGYFGSSKGKVTLYKAGNIFMKDVPEDSAAEMLQTIIEQDLENIKSSL